MNDPITPDLQMFSLCLHDKKRWIVSKSIQCSLLPQPQIRLLRVNLIKCSAIMKIQINPKEEKAVDLVATCRTWLWQLAHMYVDTYFSCWQVKNIICKNHWESWLFAVQLMTWMFLGLLLVHVVANAHLYLAAGWGGRVANDILCVANSVILCTIQCSLFLICASFNKVSWCGWCWIAFLEHSGSIS